MELTDNYRILKNKDFKNEKELKEYILENKEFFCSEVLGVTYMDHVVEFPFKPIESLHENTINVDIVFIDTEGLSHFIELKNPLNVHADCMMGIGQCLSYYYLARAYNIPLAGVYLVTSKHSNFAPLIIRDNDLPIKYVYIDRKIIAKPQI